MSNDRQTPPLRPEERINSVTAQPPEYVEREVPVGDADLVASPMDYGEMNEEDARESGYLDEKKEHQ